MTRSISLFCLAVFCTAAHAGGGPNHTEAIVIDGDDYYEVATGVTDASGCGEVRIWLSSSATPLEEDGDTYWYGEPDITLVSDSCNRTFGFNVVAADNDTLVVLASNDAGYVLDGRALAGLEGSVDVEEISSPVSVSAIRNLTGLSLPDASAACEPCCGPSPCCETGSSVGSGPIRIPIRIKHGV